MFETVMCSDAVPEGQVADPETAEANFTVVPVGIERPGCPTGRSLRCWESQALLDVVGDAFAYDHCGDVGVGADAVGHYGGVGDAQSFDATDPAVLVYD